VEESLKFINYYQITKKFRNLRTRNGDEGHVTPNSMFIEFDVPAEKPDCVSV
jgi:hypothetical protein